MTIFQNTTKSFRFGVAIVAMTVIATACGSSGEDPAVQVAGAETTAEAEESTAVVESSTSIASNDVETSEIPEETADAESEETADEESEAAEPAPEEEPEPAIVIEAEAQMVSGERFSTGEWRTTKGADILGCAGGSVLEHGAEYEIATTYTCDEGEKSGSFVGVFSPKGSGPKYSSSWKVLLTDGDFADMSGSGRWAGELDSINGVAVMGGTFTVELDVEFGAYAEPIAAYRRVVEAHETTCFYGFSASDGLAEYGTSGDVMYRIDLETGEETAHGPPPVECAEWIGDSDLGRKVALSLPRGLHKLPDGEHKIWYGPFDGEWESEVTYDEPTRLLSRSIGSNRLVLMQPESGVVFIVDATTGATVGEPFEGAFQEGRRSRPIAVSPGGDVIVFGGADVGTQTGQLLVVDAASGDLLGRVETDAPPTAVTFDPDGGEVIAGLSTGSLVTIAMDALEITSTVSLESPATISAIGVRPDGLVVALVEDAAHLVDRENGPTGDEIAMKGWGGGRIRPDGTVVRSPNDFPVYEIYEIVG
ncbi:MAG: YncE family protein [Acidimicrobiales bacterium]